MIEKFICEIKRLLKEKLFLLALVVSLELPEFCATIYSDDRNSTNRYLAWWSEHGFSIARNKVCDNKRDSAEIVYALRCFVIKPNTSKEDCDQQLERFPLKIRKAYINKSNVLKVKFVKRSSGQKNVFYKEKKIKIDINKFCLKICCFASEYYCNYRKILSNDKKAKPD